MLRRTPLCPVTVLLMIATLLIACGGGAATVAPAASGAPSGGASAVPVATSATRTGARATSSPAAGSPVAGPAPRVVGALTIFAASSLTDAFNEVQGRIEATNPGTTITFNYAASTALRTQLEQGARADIYASADIAQMDNAKMANLIVGDSSLFVRNTPVIIVPASNPRGIASPADLAKPGVKLVLAAPAVPIGNYARQIFDKMSKDPAYGADFGTKALANLVSEEANVRQVVSKIQLGEGDAGIVYASDVTPAVRDRVRIIAIPAGVNVVAEYPVAAVRGGANEAGARAFIAYLLSAEGQATLQKWGFVPVRAISSAGLVTTQRDRNDYALEQATGLAIVAQTYGWQPQS